MKDKVVMLFLDAFSSKYVKANLCPTIYKLSQENFFSELEPMFAFQGIGATMFSGTWPNSTDVWTEYVLDKNDIHKKSILSEKMIELADLIPNDKLNWYLRYSLIKLRGKKYVGTSTLIPGKLAKYFTTKLQKNYPDPDSLGQLKTVFDVLRENDLDYNYLTPGERREKRSIDLLCKNLRKNLVPTLTSLQLSSLDVIGHSHGPLSQEVQKTIRQIDEVVKNIFEASRASSDNIHLVIFSDHGMSSVKHLLNVWKILDDLPIKLGKDYLVFLDSTMARFWFFTSDSQRSIEEAFAKVAGGRILDKSQMQQFHIEQLGEEHGQMIFALNDGTVLYPDYFRRYKPPKGMHGYYDAKDNAILLVCSSKNKKFANKFRGIKNARMIDIMPTVLNLLELSVPNTCKGVNVLV